MDITQKIKSIRDDLRVSKAEMARRLDVEPPSYHRLESRGNKLSVEQLEAIAQALGITLIDILTWGQDQPKPQLESGMLNELEQLRERLKDLEHDLARSHRVIDAFTYMMNSGNGISKEKEQELVKNISDDMERAFTDSEERNGRKIKE